eukprot:GHVP01041938.1.p1 GENE.GHVP01041938.1~~GHVP01041938.1.p1  ORF type:complete len:492 (-),score=79.59 GHVP01041938.1:1580-3055(-)
MNYRERFRYYQMVFTFERCWSKILPLTYHIPIGFNSNSLGSNQVPNSKELCFTIESNSNHKDLCFTIGPMTLRRLSEKTEIRFQARSVKPRDIRARNPEDFLPKKRGSRPQSPESRPQSPSKEKMLNDQLESILLLVGGKDMIALDWLPFVSKLLQITFASSVDTKEKRRHHKEVANSSGGKIKFNHMNAMILLFEYPGYGLSESSDLITQQNCVSSLCEALKVTLRQRLSSQHPIKLHVISYSLGAAVALEACTFLAKVLARPPAVSPPVGKRMAANDAVAPVVFEYSASGEISISTLGHDSAICVTDPHVEDSDENSSRRPHHSNSLDLHEFSVEYKPTETQDPFFDESCGLKLSSLTCISPFTSTNDWLLQLVPQPVRDLVPTCVFDSFPDSHVTWDNKTALSRFLEVICNNPEIFENFRFTVFHGNNDRLVPPSMGQCLVDLATKLVEPHQHKFCYPPCIEFYKFPNLDHQSILTGCVEEIARRLIP